MVTPSMSENGVFFDGGQLSECSQFPNTERWCVKYANRQEAWDFVESNVDVDFSPKNVQVRKMVLPTNNPWQFEVALYVRWKSNQTQTSSDKKICSVVVFDKSGSMWLKSGGDSLNPWNWWWDSHTDDPTHWGSSTIPLNNITYYATWEKWFSAVSWAMLFSDIILNRFQNSNVWLVFFGEAWSIKEPLGDTPFPYSTFDLWTLDTSTNIHAWLIQAKYAFEDEDCDKKYIVLMSDWFANAYMWYWTTPTTVQWESGYVLASNETIEYASWLKNRDGIEIFSIWYELSSSIYSWLARNTLQQIASDELHYFDADVDNISNIFSEISEDQIVFLDPRVTSIIDSLWNKILWNEINITEETGITESWVVYSFPIRIDPTASWWIDTNNWLTMNYINSEWNPDSLVIPASKSSKIYWEQPKCSWAYPSWNWVFTWKWEFTQNWIERSWWWDSDAWVQRGKGDSYFELYPDNVSWYYTGSEAPWECEWTCLPWYQLNKNSDGCEEAVNTYKVEFEGNWSTAWSMDDQNIEYWKTVTLNKNNYKKEWYTFSWWNTDIKWHGTWYRDEAEVRNLVEAWESIILYAQWTANKYTVKFSGNWSTAWSMNDQEMTYDQTEPLNENRYVREWYEFEWWNTKADWTWTPYWDKALVTNLATSGNVTLYAQWSANTYKVEFEGNWSTAWSMDDQNIEYWKTVTLNKNNYKREWYTFLWWNTQQNWLWESYGDQQSVSNLVTSGSITLYAQRWINTYIIEFDWNWATAWTMTSQPVEFDNSVKLYKNSFEKEWYTFSWWNTKADWSGIWYNDEALVKNLVTDGTIILYAQWKPNSYTVVFEGNWATSWSTSDQNIVYDDTDTLNKGGFGRIWYTFWWWNTEPDWSGTWYDDEASVTNLATSGVVTLYVQWKPNPYTIAFNGNWASTWVMESQSMIYDVESNLYENKFVKEWYVFNWWNTKLDWSWKHYSDKSLVKNLAAEGTVVLYAQWKPENSWWSSGGWTKKKDDCPDGDYSWNYYDRKCWTKVNTWKTEEKVEDKPVVVPVKPDPTKKCSVEWSKHSKEVNEAYVWACENWIIKSNTIQGAKLWEFLNRAEMAKIVTVFETKILDAVPNKTKDCSAFADSISWYNSEMKNYMVASCQLERMWIHTANHKPIKDFMPRKFVSRAEFWTILSRILWWKKHEASKNSSKYYVEHLNSLKNDNILNNIDPTLKERRSYAVLMVYRAAKSLGKA